MAELNLRKGPGASVSPGPLRASYFPSHYKDGDWKMSRLQWVILPGAAVLLGVVVAYLGYLWTQSDGVVIRGVVNVYAAADPTRPYTSGGCAEGDVGPGEYADFHKGTVVRITDDAGQVLSIAGLSRGADTLDQCAFAFAAGPIDEAESYTIQVADRQMATYTHEEMVAQRWVVSFSLNTTSAQ